jgi:hypothetical protein
VNGSLTEVAIVLVAVLEGLEAERDDVPRTGRSSRKYPKSPLGEEPHCSAG